MLLGLDLGTTAVKAVVLDPERGLLAADSLPNAPASPQPGWSEQDAGAWLDNALALIPLRLRRGRHRAIGRSSRVGVAGCVPCVAAARRRRPAAASRAALQRRPRARGDRRADRRAGGCRACCERTGAGITQQSVGPKLRWLQRHEPERVGAHAPRRGLVRLARRATRRRRVQRAQLGARERPLRPRARATTRPISAPRPA